MNVLGPPAGKDRRQAGTGVTGARVDPANTAGPQIHRLLRERIIRAELAPDETLSETTIATNYGVSRQPVREAFMKLADEGLLVIRPQRVTRVRRISRAEVLDARFVREAIEADIARAVARSTDPRVLDSLDVSLHHQRAVPRSRPARFMALDEAFHRTLAEASGHVHAWQVIEGIKAQMDRVRFLSLHHFPIATLVEQHEAIVDALRAKRPGEAERAMRAHLREILSDLPGIVEAHPSMFELEGMPEAPDIAATPTPRRRTTR